MSVVLTAEECVCLFLKGLDDEELKQMTSGRDVENKIDEETIEEIKYRVWRILEDQIRWDRLLQKVKDEFGLNDDDEEDEKTDSENSDEDEPE